MSAPSWWARWTATLSAGWRRVQAEIDELAAVTTDDGSLDAAADARLAQLRKLWDRAEGFDQGTLILATTATKAELTEWWRLADMLRARVLDALAVARLDPEQALGVTIDEAIIERAEADRRDDFLLEGDAYGHPVLVFAAVIALWSLGESYFDSWDKETEHADKELAARLELNREGKKLQDSTEPPSGWMPLLLVAGVGVAVAWAATRR